MHALSIVVCGVLLACHGQGVRLLLLARRVGLAIRRATGQVVKAVVCDLPNLVA